MRQRMRTIFRWAMAHGFMESNPAGEAIDGALPPMPKVKAHLRALPYPEGGRGAQYRGCVPSLHASQAVLSISGPDGCAFR